jgi:hypothetical protein
MGSAVRDLAHFAVNLVKLTTTDLLGDLDAITTVRSVKVGPARNFHDNTSLIDKHSGQFSNDSPPLSEAGSAPSGQSQVEVCSVESGPAELEEWHGIHDTTLEMTAIVAESTSSPSLDHRQLLVKPFAGMSELYPSTHHV